MNFKVRPKHTVISHIKIDIVSKHFFAGDGEEPVAAGEDDSLLVTNATQKPLDQIPEDNEAQQVQQQTEEEPVQQQAQEEQFQQQQVQN